MKTDPKARFQGYTFYFKEGFCWIDVNSTYLKARIKAKGIFDVLSMSLFSVVKIPDIYFVSLINSEFISLYVDNFINNTSHFQINDARQLPIIVPNMDMYNRIANLASKAINLKKKISSSNVATSMFDEDIMRKLQNEIDSVTLLLYGI